jgi:hypothetical protein
MRDASHLANTCVAIVHELDDVGARQTTPAFVH